MTCACSVPPAEPAETAAILEAESSLPTRYGLFRIGVFSAGSPAEQITALCWGETQPDCPPLVRLHSECLTGDTFGSLRCDCGEQLHAALERIAGGMHGALLYLPQEGRGIGLANKIRAYALQDRGLDTVDANVALGLPIDGRDYAAAASVLLAMEMPRVRLLTNNPSKVDALVQHGIEVTERVPLVIPPNAVNLRYLHTKAARMGHMLGGDEQGEPGIEGTA